MVSEVKWTNLSRFWINSLSAEMASQNTQYIQGPKMDWTEDADLHKWFKDRREEAELLLNTVLSHIRNQETKLKFVSLWTGKEARTYVNMVDQDKKDSLKTMLDTLEDWTSPKSDEVAVFIQLRTLNQGNKTLSTYIREVMRVVDLCNFTCVGDCKDRLIRISIVVGLNSTKAYQQCISKESSLILNECIKICHTEDATQRQVQALWSESSDCTDSTPIHKIAQYPQQWGRYSFRGKGAFQSGRSNHRGGLGEACYQGQDYKHSTETTCEFCGSRPHRYRSECKASGQECFYCARCSHFSKMCKLNPENQDSHKIDLYLRKTLTVLLILHDQK